MLNPSPVHQVHKSQSRLIFINTVGHVEISIQLPCYYPTVVVVDTGYNAEEDECFLEFRLYVIHARLLLIKSCCCNCED